MIRYYQVRDTDAFIAGVQAFAGATLKGGVSAPLNVVGQPTELDELAARRASSGEDRQFSLVALNLLSDNGPVVTAQDATSGRWVKISPNSDGFIIEEVSG